MKTSARLLLCAFALVCLAGCAGTHQYVPLPDQTKPIQNPGMARIYVMRPGSLGSAVSMDVTDGGTLIGKTGPKGILCWERQPGEIELVSESENTYKLPLKVERGMVYYIKQHVRMGWLYARTKLSLLSESEGKEMMAKCKLPSIELKE